MTEAGRTGNREPAGVDPPALAFPPNPRYGGGLMRRRVIVDVARAEVRAWLGDAFHEMECCLAIERTRIASVSGRLIRYPTSSCPGAVSMLAALDDAELGGPASRYYHATAGASQCSHLYDLCVLGVLHGQCPPQRYEYEAIVPDETDQPVDVQASACGEPVIRWRIRRGLIVDGPHRGAPVRAGFLRWAERAFAGCSLAAALVLARTYLVARGRAYDAEAWAGRSTRLNEPQRGRCFAYSGAALERGVFRSGYTRDVSAGVAPSAGNDGVT